MAGGYGDIQALEAAMKITVCKDCDHRYSACWGSCPEYIEERKKIEETKARREAARRKEKDYFVVTGRRY